MQILTELPNLKRLALRGFDLSTLLNLTNTNGLVLRKLTQLSLQSCSIVKIDDVDTFIQTFPNLERLDLSENRFDYFHLPLVSGLKKLKVLILSKNRIRHLNIHPSFASNFVQPSSSLTELDLSYNGSYTSLYPCSSQSIEREREHEADGFPARKRATVLRVLVSELIAYGMPLAES